ncbi:hypothetical protein ACFL0D_03770 [Thermoproteota archaeon]
MDSKKPEFLKREELGKGYYRMYWKVPYLVTYHAMPILSEQWKLDLESGMSPELTGYGDDSFSWETNDKELEANINHMTEAIARTIPLYEKKMLELEQERNDQEQRAEEEKKAEEEFRKKVGKLLE